MSACRSCLKKEREGVRERQVLPVHRFGGGNWRQAGRRYHSSICVECATDIVSYDDQMRAEGREPGYQSEGFIIDSVRRALNDFKAVWVAL